MALPTPNIIYQSGTRGRLREFASGITIHPNIVIVSGRGNLQKVRTVNLSS